EPGCGFERLPRPSPGDVIFDIEGDPFWEPARGLHFLFGLLTHEAGTPGADAPDAEAYDHATWRYQTIWAHDRAGERQALERLVDFFHERLKDHPDMHVYHYGAYEPTALKQLMGVYATREARTARLAGRAPARRRALGRAPRGASSRRRPAKGRRSARGAAPGVARGRHSANAALAGRRAARIPPARGPAHMVVALHALPDVIRRAV